MARKMAYLVDTSFRTRVVVDVPDGFDENTDSPYEWQDVYDAITKEASEHYIEKINCDEVGDNIEEIIPDVECPYGTFDCEK